MTVPFVEVRFGVSLGKVCFVKLNTTMCNTLHKIGYDLGQHVAQNWIYDFGKYVAQNLIRLWETFYTKSDMTGQHVAQNLIRLWQHASTKYGFKLDNMLHKIGNNFAPDWATCFTNFGSNLIQLWATCGTKLDMNLGEIG